MKITALKTYPVKVPLPKVINTAIHHMHCVGCICLVLETDEGVLGEAYCFTLNAARLQAFDMMIKGFSDLVVGQDPHHLGAINDAIWQTINPTGYKGVTIAALATLDTALWDLVGKANEQPLHKLFGACREKTWTYASSGLWLNQSIDSLIAEAHEFIDAGFRAIKMRVGSQAKHRPEQHDLATDIDRISHLRQAIGDDIELMADANQCLTAKQAIRLAKACAEYNVRWLEEPVHANDLKGHAQITAAADIDIASGETEYTHLGMFAMLQAGACDVLMPDLQRVGGLSEMRRTAALAKAHHKTISTHIFTEHSLCIAGSEINCESVEHMNWFSPLFNETMQLEDGYLAIPERPGTGFTFSPTALKRFAID